MPQVARWKLRPEVREKVFDILVDSVAKVNNKNTARTFAEFLLTPTEKIMIAKRITAALLLASGANYDQIHQAVHVSTATIARIKNKYKYNEEFKKLIDQILKDRMLRKAFWEFTQSVAKSALRVKPNVFWQGVALYTEKKLDSEIL